MNNRICDLFGIRYPVISGGMVWCSGWELASAVSNAGGLGLIGAGSMHPEVLREHIRKCKAAIKKAFQKQMAGEGFTFVEVLSTCPTNWGMTPLKANQWLQDNMVPYYPLGVIKETAPETAEVK